MGGPGDLVGLSAGCRDVLVVAGQGTLKAARKPERAKGKGALGVGDVVQHLPDAPFIGRVAVQRFFFGDRREECLFQLILERGKRIVAGYLVDVSEIIRVRLQWSAGGKSWLDYRFFGCSSVSAFGRRDHCQFSQNCRPSSIYSRFGLTE